MASQRDWEKRIWRNLAATMSASCIEDIMPDMTPLMQSGMSIAEDERLGKAWAAVEARLYKLGS